MFLCTCRRVTALYSHPKKQKKGKKGRNMAVEKRKAAEKGRIGREGGREREAGCNVESKDKEREFKTKTNRLS